MENRELKLFLDYAVKRIKEGCNPEKIVLFGSHARGDATADSDVDLLVVVSTQGSIRQKAIESDTLLSDRRAPLDLIVRTPEQLEMESRMIGSVIMPALEEGKALYERAA